MSDEPPRRVEEGDVFDVLPTLPDEYAEAAVVDYPWNHDSSKHFNGGRRQTEHAGDWSDIPHDGMTQVLEELARTVTAGGWVFVWADDDVYPEFRETVEDSPLTYRKTLIWDTERIGMGWYFRGRHQFVLAATNGDTERWVQDRATVVRAPNPNAQPGTEALYPTSKPPEAYTHLLDAPVLEAGERLLAPFCGSGPGHVAAARNGWAYHGIDANDEAVELASTRAELGDRTIQAAVTDGGEDAE